MATQSADQALDTAVERSDVPGAAALAATRDSIISARAAGEEGRISFAQANELLAAPTVARGTLLDRVLRSRGRVASAKVRDWVNDVRQQTKRGHERIVAEIVSADLDQRAS